MSGLTGQVPFALLTLKKKSLFTLKHSFFSGLQFDSSGVHAQCLDPAQLLESKLDQPYLHKNSQLACFWLSIFHPGAFQDGKLTMSWHS